MKMLNRRTFLALAASAAVTLTQSGQAAAEYPTKPVTVVAPYGAGGSSDLAARALAAAAPSYLGQPVMVVNKTGAGGVTGSTYVSRSRSDGYTLLLARVGSQATVPALNETIPYQWDSFSFLGLLELNPYVFVVQADSPYKTLDDLVSAIKQKPGELSYSTSGPQGLLNMGSQKLLQEAGLSPGAAIPLPYKGGGGAKNALLGGHVDFLGINLSPVLGQIQAGKLRALAVTTTERFDQIPEVPTVRESGYPGLESIIGWSGLWAPKNIPEDVKAKWIDTLAKIKEDKDWNKMTTSLGSIPKILPPDETQTFVKAQYDTFYQLGENLQMRIKR